MNDAAKPNDSKWKEMYYQMYDAWQAENQKRLAAENGLHLLRESVANREAEAGTTLWFRFRRWLSRGGLRSMWLLALLVGCSPDPAGPILSRRDVEQTGSIAVTICPDTLKVPDQSAACYDAWRKLGAP